MGNPKAEPLKDNPELRQQVIDTCLYMRDQLGYFVAWWGNMAVRVEEGILLTPTRLDYSRMQPDDLVVISYDTVILKGHRLPTSETPLHRELLLERPDLAVLIHSHSPWASAAASAHCAIPVMVDDMAEVIGGEVHCSAHAPSGHHEDMAKAARAAIGPDACGVLLGNHGVVAGGRDIPEAVAACQILEKAAMAFLVTQGIGGVKAIPEPLWREERDRYLYKYGKKDDLDGVVKHREGA